MSAACECPICSMRARIRELETKLREAEGRIAAHEAAAAQNIVNEVLLEKRAEKAERERDAKEAHLDTALWDLDRARTALGGLGHPSGDVALGIGVLKELYEQCGRCLDEARRERDEARERLTGASQAIHSLDHPSSWENCPDIDCKNDRADLGEKP